MIRAKLCLPVFCLIIGPILFLKFFKETLGLEEDNEVTAADTRETIPLLEANAPVLREIRRWILAGFLGSLREFEEEPYALLSLVEDFLELVTCG